MKRQFDAACRQYVVKKVCGEGHTEWIDGLKSGLPSVKLLGKTVQASNPTTAAPQEVKANNATVRSFGKNLFIRLKEGTDNGVTLTHLADGGYMLNGTCTGSTNFQTKMRLPAGRYTLSCVYDGVMPDDGNARAQVYNPSNPVVWSSIGNSEAIDKSFSFTVSSACSPYFRIRAQQGHTYDHVKVYPLLVRGKYTSGTMPAFTPYWDGGEAMAPTLYEVDTYRDEWNAQTGKGIRRCGVIESYAGEPITTPYISTTGELSEGARVVYGIPDAPFETTPSRLTCPTGYGQIIQMAGDVPDAPLEVKYLSHGGNVK